jgi:hypothetical protein
MPLDDAARAYSTELLHVLLPMTTTPSFDERRRRFRREVHRAFDAEFFPSLLQLLGVMSQHPKSGTEMAFQLLAAIAFELRDFLAPLESESLGPEAVCLDLVVAPLAAGLSQAAGEDKEEPDVALAKAVIRREGWIVQSRDQLNTAFDRIATQAEARGRGEGAIFDWMREEAERWQELPKRIELLEWLLSVSRLGSEADRLRVLRQGLPGRTVNALEAGSLAMALADALGDQGENVTAGGAREAMTLIMIGALDGREIPWLDE